MAHEEGKGNTASIIHAHDDAVDEEGKQSCRVATMDEETDEERRVMGLVSELKISSTISPRELLRLQGSTALESDDDVGMEGDREAEVVGGENPSRSGGYSDRCARKSIECKSIKYGAKDLAYYLLYAYNQDITCMIVCVGRHRHVCVPSIVGNLLFPDKNYFLAWRCWENGDVQY